MARTVIYVKQNDTAREWNYSLTYVGSDGTTYAYNLSGSTVSLILDTPNGRYVRTPTIVSEVSGSIRYTLVAEDTAYSGTAKMEFVVSSSDGKLTFPTDNPIYLDVYPAL